MRYVAIGDIHGHYTELMDLMIRVVDAGVDFKRDTLVFLGDYVDGGPDTRSVLEFLIELQRLNPHFVFLLGNHEDMMRRALAHAFGSSHYAHWYYQGGAATLASYEEGGRLREHLDWIDRLPTLHLTDDYAFVHAGLCPGRIPEATTHEDRLWIREEFIDSDYDWGKQVVFGHTPCPGNRPLVLANKIGIDTMPRDEGQLTAVILEPKEAGVYRTPTFVHAPSQCGVLR